MNRGGKPLPRPRQATHAGSDGWRKRWSHIGAGAMALSVGLACQAQLAPIAMDDGTVSFSAQVLPILNTNCFRCHRDGGQADLAGIELSLVPEDSYDALVGQPSQLDPTLTHVIPGDSEASLLYLIISSDSPPIGTRMPQGEAPLSPSDISLVRDWIDQGALNN